MNVQSTKRNEIIEATLALIAERGVHNTPMSLVSKSSGIAAGTIYHYFESKEKLINEIYIDIKRAVLMSVMKDDDSEKSYKDRFFGIWSAYYDYLVEQPNTLLFLEQCSSIPILSEEVRQQADVIATPLLDFFYFGIESGILKLPNIELVLALIHGSIVNIAKLHISGQLNITEEHKISAINYSWEGLT